MQEKNATAFREGATMLAMSATKSLGDVRNANVRARVREIVRRDFDGNAKSRCKVVRAVSGHDCRFFGIKAWRGDEAS